MIRPRDSRSSGRLGHRWLRLDVTTLLAGLVAGILPACLFVVISYLYLAGVNPEVLSSLQEPHLERSKERVDLLGRAVGLRRDALATEVLRALGGDPQWEDPPPRAALGWHTIEEIHWYLHHLDDASYRRSPRAYPLSPTRHAQARPGGAASDGPSVAESGSRPSRASERDRGAAGSPETARPGGDPIGFSYALAGVAFPLSMTGDALARQIIWHANELDPGDLRAYLRANEYRIRTGTFPVAIGVERGASPYVPGTLQVDTARPDRLWLAVDCAPNGTLALALPVEPFLAGCLTTLEERWPTPEGVVFRLERVGPGTPESVEADRLWGRWPLYSPFDRTWELWVGNADSSQPLLLTVLDKLGAIHYLYGGLLLLALMTIASFFLTGFLSRRVRDSRQKDDFVRLVSHELRTPIASIRMIAETLRLNRVRSEEERGEFLSQLEDESLRLTDLIERVLEYGQSAGEREVVTDPGELVEIAVRRFRDRERRHVEIRIRTAQEFHPVLLDREAVVGVISNLLSNASKYSPSDMPIEITVGEESRQLFVEVRDYGPGIKPRDAKRVFKPFYRGESSAFTRGFGLGLAYCREVARAHKGRITLKSRPGRGSRFTLEIPLLRAGPGEAPHGEDSGR